jgi:integrase
MAVYKRGDTWWYSFRFANRRIQESAKTQSKTLAKQAEENRRKGLEEGYNGLVDDERSRRLMTVTEAKQEFLSDYTVRHRATSVRYTEQRLAHVVRLLGKMMHVEVGENTLKGYQNSRMQEKASPKSINEEIRLLLRMMRRSGDVIQGRMKREKTLRIKAEEFEGKALTADEIAALYQSSIVVTKIPGQKRDSKGTRTQMIKPAIALALNATMRRGEIENLRWGQIDFLKNKLTVGRSKTEAGTGRIIPLNSELRAMLEEYRQWYEGAVAPAAPEHYVFPFGNNWKWDPTKPITTLKTAWANVRERAKVKARFHDLRHTAITNLLESGAPEATIMAIAGHVSRKMLEHYAHVRMESKREAVEAIGRFGAGTEPGNAKATQAAS